ncbi:NADH-quinone oxidoreductase subunit A [Vulcanisaeta thermophila]|uniref:NADH-quinone oxidoreductase subunit A n=1 Tax=Vulcanisaeta thermophila TaxID=867917 RepID=UPI0008530B34|nr:NADH-quinone oxidoreductase subunit A [Vulcanisaeta thermophila]
MSAFVDALAVLIVLIVIALITDAALMFVVRKIAARNPNVVKLQRYEAGNPPVGDARYVFPIQYVGFLIMFLGIEPVIVLLLVLTSALAPTMPLAIMVLLILVLSLPSIYVAYKYALKLAYPSDLLRRRAKQG